MPRSAASWLLAAVIAVNGGNLLAQSWSADHFDRIKLTTNIAEPREETEASLTLEADRLAVRSRTAGSDLKVLPYSGIRRAEYSYTTGRRWKASALVAVLWSLPQLPPGPFAALPILLVKGKRHWLTITSDKDVVLLRLDKTNYRTIVSSFEARSGVKVETVGERK